MPKQPTVRINPASPRARFWQRIFERIDDIPVTSAVPVETNFLPGLPTRPVYGLDLARVTAEERGRLAQHICERFGIPLAAVDAALDEDGYSLLAEDVLQ